MTPELLVTVLDANAAAQIRKSLELGMEWAMGSRLPIASAVRELYAQCDAIARNVYQHDDTAPWPADTGPSNTPARISFRVEEVAAMTGVSPRTVQSWIDQDGGLASLKIGGCRLIHADDLHAFLLDHREDTP